jgi:hypothetical protein
MQQRHPCCRVVRLLERLAQGSGDHGVLALGHVGQGIAGPMHAGAVEEARIEASRAASVALGLGYR